jgi:outer membrane protein assembly factor BamB
MWGGHPGRNMVSETSDIPESWDVKTGKNVKWVASLGSQSYGSPTVADGMVFSGTNNEGQRDPRRAGDAGVLMCFRESDGQFLWQNVSRKLPSAANDWPYVGVCSSPLVEADRLYYVTNRCEVVCLNPGKYSDLSPELIWKFDMIAEIGTYPHNMCNSSPVAHGELLFVSTSNGQDEAHTKVPAPGAPALIALNKKTGKLVWSDNSVGDRILHGQWSSPTVSSIGGVIQVIMGQGDGWVRGFEANTGKKLWEFDLNPKDSVWPKNRNEIISTPVIYNDAVYIASGQDPEQGEGEGHLYAIDATKRGDITATGRIWHYGKIGRSISTAAIKDGLVYYADFSGLLHCLDAANGTPYWVHDTEGAIWGSPVVIGDKVYIGNEDGLVTILRHGKTKTVLAEIDMGRAIYSTPVPANGTLFIATRNQLWAIARK